ncbi:secreted RxLR effector protein 161-like [Xenia sp. Carnegie-2017]|uniref:secreted RxLR effector protein 161-like n=1 Tax=Xenia sp. Carnegie-2017 TaxID=2897299 RepID=UPI001F03F7E7|nr:secreted RxLR effector protein 161-like [Xenia sp. Carnegie-2017]
MSDCKPKPTPCVLGIENVLSKESPELNDPKLYRAMIGSLIYVMTGTRPDLCYVVTKLSQKMSKPTRADLSIAKHVLRYLKGTQELGLIFQKSSQPLTLKGFSDSDWGASIEDRRSITGYNFQLSQQGPLISWKSRKQPTVALSTCEAEYVALANAVQEAKFLMQLCQDMKVGINEGKSLIMIDNQGAMNLAKNPVHHQRSKHIDIKYHFIRSEIQKGRINLEYVTSEENIADIFTKPASKNKLEKFKQTILGKI